MFKLLKEKLKSAVSKISGKIEEEGKKEELPVEELKPEPALKQEPLPAPEPVTIPTPQPVEQPKEEKKGFFSTITSLFSAKEQAKEEEETKETEQLQDFISPKQLKPALEKSPVEEFAPQIVEEVKKELEVKEELAQPAEEIVVEEPKVEDIKEILAETKVEHTPYAPKPEIRPVIEKKETPKEEPQEKKGFFSALKEKILTTAINEQQFEDMFFDLELALLENNVAVEVIDKIKYDLKVSLVDHPIRRNKVEETVLVSLKDSIRSLFEEPFDLVLQIKKKQEKPFIISFVGINGSGKTTSIAKMASMLTEKGFSVVLAAGDTFRAASIEQLSQHGDRLGLKVIKQRYGADPAAVAFDAIKHAQAKNVDVVLIDTAGRMHSNTDLIQELKKIVRVSKPDLKLFVGESITGNDCVEQAKTFHEAVGIDGIILTKADIDEKGGAAVSVSYVTKKPILYIGTGQEYKDLKPFDAALVMENLGLEES
jgi:fused signal recognition particle receptor